MGKESGSWHPLRWSPGRLHRFTLHVYKVSLWAACQILGEYEGNLVAAKIASEYMESKSVAMLRAKGVALIGDNC